MIDPLPHGFIRGVFCAVVYFALAWTAFGASPVAAQEDASLLTVADLSGNTDLLRVRLNTEHRFELDAIDTESCWASVLYTTSAISFIGSLPMAFFTLVSQFDVIWVSLTGAVGGVSLVSLGLAIGLDVDSKQRRESVLADVLASVSVSPGGISVSGRF